MKVKRCVAICDILGFKKLIESRPLNEVIDRHLLYLQKCISHSIHQKTLDPIPSIKKLKKNPRVGFSWFSDTIIFYGLKDNIESHRAVVETVGWLIFETMLNQFTRIRAGISYGELYIDSSNDIYVGQPIVDAHNLEEIQNWSGAALTEVAVEKIGSNENWLIPYDVPIKFSNNKNDFYQTLAVDWTQGIHTVGKFKLNWNEKRETPKLKDYLSCYDVIIKWRNTRKFHNNVCKSCNNSN